MDASQLRSAISDLQRECSQLERENSSMQREINAICSSAQSATCSLTRTYDASNRTLDGSTNIIEYADQTLQTISSEQDNIEVLYRGFKNIETANKRIRELNNKIYFEFANFRMVRKIVRAFIDNISLEMVTPELIYKSVEKEHLQSPDFWLSCSMLAIMHWKDDDQNASSRALEQAMKLDERQTVLFFLSFNLLLGRKDAALKWFACYQKLEKTGDDAEFILLLLHATNLREDVNDALTKSIKAYLSEEYSKSATMNDRATIVEMVKEHLVQYNSSENFVFDYLRNYVKDYSTMSDVLSMAKDNAAILEFVERTNCSSRGKGYIYIERFMSQLLDTPDKKERAYTDEIGYNETIIKCVGDLAQADEMYNKRHQHDVSPLNLMQECIGWLFGSQNSELSEVARSNMFLLCRDLIEEAAQKYFAEYRAELKDSHPVAIKDYSTEMNFKNKAAEIKKVEDFYSKKKTAQLATVKNTSIILCIVFAAICLIGGVASFVYNGFIEGNAMLILMGFLLVMTVILALSAVVNLFRNKKKRKNIVETNDSNLLKAKEIVDNLFVEYGQYQSAYEDSDRLADEIVFAIKR